MQSSSVSGATQPGMPSAAAQQQHQPQMLSHVATTQAVQAAQAAQVAPTSSAGPTAPSQPAPQSYVTPYFWEWQNYPGPVQANTSWQCVGFDIRHGLAPQALSSTPARHPQCHPLQPSKFPTALMCGELLAGIYR